MAISKRKNMKFSIYILLILCFLVIKMVWSTRTGKAYSSEKLHGRQLKVVTGNFPPTIVILRNSSGHVIGYEGLLHQQLLFLSQALGFTFEILPVKENTNGVRQWNGSWTGNIGTLLRGEADLALGPFAVSLERYQAIDFCGMIGGDDTSILVKYPQPRISHSGAVNVFSTNVWIGLLLSAATIVFFAIFIIYFKKRVFHIKPYSKKMANTEDIIIYVFGTITSQGSYFRAGHKSIGALAVTWCFAAFVFVNSYNSTLTSYLSITFQRPDINTFEDLAISPIYEATILEGSIQDIDILVADKGHLKMIGDKLRRCSDCRMRDLDEIVMRVLFEDNFVSIQPSSFAKGLLQKYSPERNNCQLTLAQEKLAWKPFFFAVPKSSPYGESISLESMRWLASGLPNYWLKKKETGSNHCQLVYNNKGTSTKRSSNRLKLEQFYIPFVVLFTGYLLALLSFIWENIYCGYN